MVTRDAKKVLERIKKIYGELTEAQKTLDGIITNLTGKVEDKELERLLTFKSRLDGVVTETARDMRSVDIFARADMQIEGNYPLESAREMITLSRINLPYYKALEERVRDEEPGD